MFTVANPPMSYYDEPEITGLSHCFGCSADMDHADEVTCDGCDDSVCSTCAPDGICPTCVNHACDYCGVVHGTAVKRWDDSDDLVCDACWPTQKARIEYTEKMDSINAATPDTYFEAYRALYSYLVQHQSPEVQEIGQSLDKFHLRIGQEMAAERKAG